MTLLRDSKRRYRRLCVGCPQHEHVKPSISATSVVSEAGEQGRTFAYEPTAPTGLSGVAAFNAVELAWAVPTEDGLSSITGYSIQSSTNGADWVTEIADTGSSATTATVTGLVGGTAYQFRVAAINEIGVGQYSPASNAVTLAVVAPPEAEPAEPANGSPTFTG